MMSDEKGQALPLVLLVLAVGTLVIAPFLGQASSGLIGSRTYGEAIAELYSSDAGVEYAIWHLMNGETVVPEFTINNKTVSITVEDLGQKGQIYKITSTATSADGSNTTIESYVVDAGGNVQLDSGVQITGNVYVEGNVQLEEDATINGNVCAGGDVQLKKDATINGDVYAGGDVQLEEGATISGDYPLPYSGCPLSGAGSPMPILTWEIMP